MKPLEISQSAFVNKNLDESDKLSSYRYYRTSKHDIFLTIEHFIELLSGEKKSYD